MYAHLKDIPSAASANYRKYGKAAQAAKAEADKLIDGLESPGLDDSMTGSAVSDEVGKEWWADMSVSHVSESRPLRLVSS